MLKNQDPKPKIIKRSVEHIEHAVRNVKIKASDFSELFRNSMDGLHVEDHFLQLESRDRLQHLDQKTTVTGKDTAHIKESVDKYLPEIKGRADSTSQAVMIAGNRLASVDDKVQQLTEDFGENREMVVLKVKDYIDAKDERRDKKMEEQEERIATMLQKLQEQRGIDAQNLLNAFLKSHEAKKGEKSQPRSVQT
jgi:hypothetical protein